MWGRGGAGTDIWSPVVCSDHLYAYALPLWTLFLVHWRTRPLYPYHLLPGLTSLAAPRPSTPAMAPSELSLPQRIGSPASVRRPISASSGSLLGLLSGRGSVDRSTDYSV